MLLHSAQRAAVRRIDLHGAASIGRGGWVGAKRAAVPCGARSATACWHSASTWPGHSSAPCDERSSGGGSGDGHGGGGPKSRTRYRWDDDGHDDNSSGDHSGRSGGRARWRRARDGPGLDASTPAALDQAVQRLTMLLFSSVIQGSIAATALAFAACYWTCSMLVALMDGACEAVKATAGAALALVMCPVLAVVAVGRLLEAVFLVIAVAAVLSLLTVAGLWLFMGFL